MSNFDINSNNDILNIKTVQISPFRTLMTALKDILLETNIDFTPNGIRIINMDKSHTVLAHMNLAAENFEFFQCKKNKITWALALFFVMECMKTQTSKIANSLKRTSSVERELLSRKYFSLHSLKLKIMCSSK